HPTCGVGKRSAASADFAAELCMPLNAAQHPCATLPPSTWTSSRLNPASTSGRGRAAHAPCSSPSAARGDVGGRTWSVRAAFASPWRGERQAIDLDTLMEVAGDLAATAIEGRLPAQRAAGRPASGWTRTAVLIDIGRPAAEGVLAPVAAIRRSGDHGHPSNSLLTVATDELFRVP
ncbi:hypothetical protein, partial [Nonomuraea rubra]|uniref:hypothetical protein n=1 Tax=Nonomuraea rubra TaxID=46180 RepID=UPI0031EAB9AA